MKRIIAIAILLTSSAVSMDGPFMENKEGDIVQSFKVNTKRLKKHSAEDDLDIMHSANLVVVTPEGMSKRMGAELEELQKLPNIAFHKFDPSQLDHYGQFPGKIVEFKQGEANIVSTVNPDEDRLIFTNFIIDCVGLFIWKPQGPLAFAHLDQSKIANGQVGRILGKIKAKVTDEDMKLFQVYLISTAYSQDVRSVYSTLKAAGFPVTAKTIFDMYFDVPSNTRFIALPSVGLSANKLKKLTTERVVDAFEKQQNRPMIPHVLAATLRDGKLYGMTEAVGLVRVVKQGKSGTIQTFLKTLAALDPEKAEIISAQLNACATPEEAMKLLEKLQISQEKAS